MKTTKLEINADYLRECVSYNPYAGVFTWNVRPIEHFKDARAQKIWNTKYSGKQAGALMKSGYVLIRIHKQCYYAHRLAWLYMNGSWPQEIDHINGSPADNRIGNLRSVSHAENGKNVKIPSHNSTGVIGVCIPNDGGRIQARIQVDGKQIKLGRFDSIEEAKKARLIASRKYGFHENHGR
ncbi:HNH endonuclease signature motif containing protein [Mixta gaviniae]|uniref:HNH endonuclease n=1 Tax=Mixta gaviniae TaxID=665914 RepID=A0A2L0II85_9GAMM|nr:HNH endonuclease signature motif containing protein [Mixta gaviniae]AUX94234.1 HNH endonuclease [Mixta gaviniae]